VSDRAGRASGPAALRSAAERLAGALPPLLAEAEMLAATVSMGVHGRRRSGSGEDFWQYRQAIPGDALAQIDWRRSARSDQHFIRQMEWESAQTVSLWVDHGRSMDYRSPPSPRSKRDRAALLALALSVLLVKAGERVSLLGTDAAPPRGGRAQLARIALELAAPPAERPDYAAPPSERLVRGGRAVFFSDFLADPQGVMPALDRAADQGIKGCFVQVLDETEETFPFDGRMIFESMGGTLDFETQRARALKAAYLERLAARRAELDELARGLGWRVLHHRTSESPRKALLWLYMAIGPQG
jgi:uncharacterized protein (DUF58 family)